MENDKELVLAVFPCAYVAYIDRVFRVYPKPDINEDIGSGKTERAAWHSALFNLA